MKNKEAIKLVVGSVVVYIAVACSSATSGFGPLSGGDDASTARGASDGAAGTGSGGGQDTGAQDTGMSIIDALTDPVSSAMADPYQSGTRLKAKYYAGADGSKVYAGMHDSQLNVDCGYLTSSDGMTRCLPASGAAYASFFSDAGCTQGLAYTGTACSSVPAYVYAPKTSGCTTTYQVLQVMGPYSGTTYYGTPASCIPLSTDADASALSKDYAASFAAYTFYTVGAAVPPTQFVQATVQTDP